MSQAYRRTLPLLSDANRFFWTSGAEGVLRILRCEDCGYWIHPPSPVCPKCFGHNLSPQPVSGRGEVETYTLNMRSWGPGLEVPYVIAIVALDEQPGLRLTTNIIDIPPQEVRIGLRVEATFEQDEDVWLPMFRPAG